jgi:hypothetical protein
MILYRKGDSLKNPVCFMYQINFEFLTLKLQKEERENYNYALMHLILDEYNNRHFIASKINKATKKGTKIKFEAIKDYKVALDKIFELYKELNIRIEIDEGQKGGIENAGKMEKKIQKS